MNVNIKVLGAMLHGNSRIGSFPKPGPRVIRPAKMQDVATTRKLAMNATKPTFHHAGHQITSQHTFSSF
jgi:hypothetical protein